MVQITHTCKFTHQNTYAHLHPVDSCEIGQYEWHFHLDICSACSRLLLELYLIYFFPRSFLFFVFFFFLDFMCVREKQCALFTPNLWSWHPAMVLCIAYRCVWGCLLEIHFVKGCSVRPVCVPAKTQAVSWWLSLPRLKMKARLCCYHSTMTEHNVVPVCEC